MSAILTTFLLSTLTLFTKKAVGGLFEKDSIIGDAAKETSVGLVKSTFERFKDKFQTNIYQTPDNNELLRSVRMSYLNSALFLCFSRLKSFDTGKWDTIILQNLPQSEGVFALTKKIREQFLPAVEPDRKEVEWIISACDKFEQNRTTINNWKPDDDFHIAVKQIELFLMAETESVEPLVVTLKNYLSGKLISELAETAYYQPWNEGSPPALNSPSSPENTNALERQKPVVQSVIEAQLPVSEGKVELTTTQRLNKRHRSSLPPKLLDWIENGWEEVQSPQSAVNPLGLGGKTKTFEWFDVMCAFFAKEIKENQKVADIFQTKLLMDLKYRHPNGQTYDLSVDVFRDELSKQNQLITAKFETIELEVKNLNLAQTDIKSKVENLLPMVASVADISQTVKTISQDVKDILQTVSVTSQDVKQVVRQMNNVPERLKEDINRTIQAIETSRGEVHEGFSKLESLVARSIAQPSGNRETVDLDKLKMDLEEIEMDVNAKFSKLVVQLLKGLRIAKQLPSGEVAAKTEREKYLHFLGLVYFLIGKVDEAIAYHQEAMNWAELNLPAQKKIVNLCNIGNVYLENGNVGKAVACYEEAIQILKRNLNFGG
jgi:tetratricopeptide (TPR) repeat protein